MVLVQRIIITASSLHFYILPIIELMSKDSTVDAGLKVFEFMVYKTILVHSAYITAEIAYDSK